MPVITPSQVRAQVAAIRRRLPDATVIGLQAPGDWQGGAEVACGGTTFRVEPCVSDLQMREALLRHSGQPVVLLTEMDESSLSDDVVIRLTKRRLFPLNRREMLRELFQAKSLDPQLLSWSWLVGALTERMPESGFPPVPGGTLDVETVWGVLLKLYLGLNEARPDLESFLMWTLTSESLAAMDAVAAEFRADLERWLEEGLGKAGTFVFAAIRAGRGADLAPLGLALGVIYASGAQDAALRDAAVRLEAVFAGKKIPTDAAESWATAAAAVIRKVFHTRGEPAGRTLLDRVDVILNELRIGGSAALSDYSPSGFEARLGALADAFTSALDHPGTQAMTAVTNALASVEHHFLAALSHARMARCRMALRLIRWLHMRDNAPAANLAASATDYVNDGAFVDWGRHALFAGDGNLQLARAFTRIVERAGEKRDAGDRNFAEKLAAALSTNEHDAGLLGIESVMKEVVAPLVAHAPVLVIVMDGMSHAVFRELLPDLTRRGWRSLGHAADRLPRPVLAGLPSITEISRRALLTGALDYTSLLDEASGFEKLGELLGLPKNSRPQLFRKGELTEIGETGLPDKIQQAIAQTKNRLVGAVVNAIDDYLLKGDQLAVTWDLALLPALDQLLHAARDSGRIVVLASDHGHVIDRETELRKAEGSDRYRPDDAKPAAGELVFRGARIRAATGHDSVILPITERLRYAGKKNGYHGGATPQEVLAPLAVLTTLTKIPAGWDELPPYEPAWWSSQPAPVAAPVSMVTKPRKASSDLPLFDFAKGGATPTTAHWTDALLASDIFLAQQKFAGRTPLAKASIRAFLSALEERGFTILRPTLAQKLGLPLLRVGGLVSTMQRVLNVDGYDVLAFESEADTIRLNLDLLKTQFEIK